MCSQLLNLLINHSKETACYFKRQRADFVKFSWFFNVHFDDRLDNKSAGRQSIASNLMKQDDEVDDGDSMAAYGEGDTGKFVQIIIFLNTKSSIQVARLAIYSFYPQRNFFFFVFCLYFIS